MQYCERAVARGRKSSYVETEDTRQEADITKQNAETARTVGRMVEYRTVIQEIVTDLEGAQS